MLSVGKYDLFIYCIIAFIECLWGIVRSKKALPWFHQVIGKRIQRREQNIVKLIFK